MRKYQLLFGALISGMTAVAQPIQNVATLHSFTQKLNDQKGVVNIVLLGDSHIQAGYISEVLSTHFETIYGYAGRGLVFPYRIANSNGELDYKSTSNQAWTTFRSVHKQNIIPEMGALGFVMNNTKPSFIQIHFNKVRDEFDRVWILNDSSMYQQAYNVYTHDAPVSLEQFINKQKKVISYTVQDNETYPELAAKFNTTTTKLLQLNGERVKNPTTGMKINTEVVDYNYNPNFESFIQPTLSGTFDKYGTVIKYAQPTNDFILQTNAMNYNRFYGFYFYNSQAKKGVIFNTVGINGATYGDFLKYPLQLEQINQINPDLVMIALGTNEAFGAVQKDEYLHQVKQVINNLRASKPDVGILLISPTDNKLKATKTKEVVNWTQQASEENNVAFLNQYENMGGAGYFMKSLNNKQANTDGVHFLPKGYQLQAEKIWDALVAAKIVNK